MQCHSFTDPPIIVTVTPSSFVGLDHHLLYNRFSLTCDTSKPVEVLPELQVDWLFQGNLINNNSTEHNIRSYSVSGGAAKSSMLDVIVANVSNSGVYTCRSRIVIPNYRSIQAIDSATVTIRGKLRYFTTLCSGFSCYNPHV